jgi:hypothetical protein
MTMKATASMLSAMLGLSLLLGCVSTAVEGKPVPPDVEALLAEEREAYVILTFDTTPDSSLEERLELAGIALCDPLGSHAYQAYLPASAVGALGELKAEERVTGVALIDPESKVRGDFDDPAATYDVVVHLYDAPTADETTALEEGLTILRTGEGVMHFVEGQATGAQIRALVALPFVKALEAAALYNGG